MKFTEDDGNKVVYIQISNIKELTYKGIRQAYYFIGDTLRRTTQDLINDNDKTGRVYVKRLGGRLVRHQASAPGEPPANFTGRLRNSIGFDVRGGTQLEFGSRPILSVKEDYAKNLELGDGRVAARPYLKPSIIENQKEAYTYFEQELEKSLNEGANK